MKLKKRFSIAHYDSWTNPFMFYQAILNATPEFRQEIFDIYFGKKFRYTYREQELWDGYSKMHDVSYGNVMGVEASDEQVENLFRIQREFGIEISLTINQLNIPPEIFYSKKNRVIGAFLEWLGIFYSRGLRSCTLANNHLMSRGLLQQQFPEMRWKNTVNQQVSTSQQVLDYLYLGYNTIQLDRSLNRDLEELKRIKEIVEKYKSKHPSQKVTTCLLVWEDCMPSCPYKREHDDLQIFHRTINYWENQVGIQTCNRWRNKLGKSPIPRCGTNCNWAKVTTFEEYAELVDIFKYSGRLGTKTPDGEGSVQFAWVHGNNAVTSFSKIIDNQLEPVQSWSIGTGILAKYDTNIETIKAKATQSIWMTEKGQVLEKRLKTCRNRCHACHLCEKTFGIPDFDSLLEH